MKQSFLSKSVIVILAVFCCIMLFLPALACAAKIIRHLKLKWNEVYFNMCSENCQKTPGKWSILLPLKLYLLVLVLDLRTVKYFSPACLIRLNKYKLEMWNSWQVCIYSPKIKSLFFFLTVPQKLVSQFEDGGRILLGIKCSCNPVKHNPVSYCASLGVLRGFGWRLGVCCW